MLQEVPVALAAGEEEEVMGPPQERLDAEEKYDEFHESDSENNVPEVEQIAEDLLPPDEVDDVLGGNPLEAAPDEEEET